MLASLALFLLGLGLTVVGAELLVRGSSRLARLAGISPLVIGLTVVAFGTSAPEMAVSVQSALTGGEIALGNVVGSNIFNILVILGLSALIVPLAVAQQLIRIDVPIMVAATVLVWILGSDGDVSRREGLVLLLGIIGYTVLAIRLGRSESRAIQEEYSREFGGAAAGSWGAFLNLILVLAGLGLLVQGAGTMVDNAVEFAELLGVSELIIGLTIVAAGTSIPEVVTSIVAALRGERDIAVGNVVGSNIFNLLAVLGMAATASPRGVIVSTAALNFDFPVVLAVSVICLPIFFTGGVIARWEGGLFLLYYALYAGYLFLASSGRDAVEAYEVVVLLGVVPLTLGVLAISLVRSLRRKRS